MREPEFGRIQGDEKPSSSIFCIITFGYSSVSRAFSICSKITSVGIISKAPIWSKRLKTIWALAGITTLKRGIMMMIYYELTSDMMCYKPPAMSVLMTTSLWKLPVSFVLNISSIDSKTSASVLLTYCDGKILSITVPLRTSCPIQSYRRDVSEKLMRIRSKLSCDIYSGLSNSSLIANFFLVYCVTLQLKLSFYFPTLSASVMRMSSWSLSDSLTSSI